jgi:putative sterol carrier protein
VIPITFQNIFNEIKEKAASFDGGSYDGFLAIQVTLSDLNEVFYAEIKDGKLSIEPYEYYDRQANLIISSENFVKMINKKLDPVVAFTTGKLKIEGDIGRATEFSKLFKE